MTILLETRTLFAAWSIGRGNVDGGLVIGWQVVLNPDNLDDYDATMLVPLVAHTHDDALGYGSPAWPLVEVDYVLAHSWDDAQRAAARP